MHGKTIVVTGGLGALGSIVAETAARIFADLEKVVPYNVRITSIRPSVAGPNQISLDMTVGAEAPAPVIDLLKNLENSPRFGAVYSHSLLPPTQTDKLYRCRVSVNYVQKL